MSYTINSEVVMFASLNIPPRWVMGITWHYNEHAYIGGWGFGAMSDCQYIVIPYWQSGTYVLPVEIYTHAPNNAAVW